MSPPRLPRMSPVRAPRLALALAALEVAAGEERPRTPLREQLTLPVVVLAVAVVYFVWAALLGLRIIALPALEPTITPADWAAGGAVLFVVLLLVLLVYQRQAPPVPAYAPAGAADAPAYTGAIPPAQRWPDDELVVTAEDWQGRRVLEYSRPPKSDHPRAVYAKCLVPVDTQLVLRVEDLVAEARD